MGIQEGDDVPYGHRGPQHPRPYQPFSLFGSEDSYVWELGHIIFQAFLQVFCMKMRNLNTVTTGFFKNAAPFLPEGDGFGGMS